MFCTVMYCDLLYCDPLYCTLLWCTLLWYALLFCDLLYFTVLYCMAVLYGDVLYCDVLYCTMHYTRYILLNSNCKYGLKFDILSHFLHIKAQGLMSFESQRLSLRSARISHLVIIEPAATVFW